MNRYSSLYPIPIRKTETTAKVTVVENLIDVRSYNFNSFFFVVSDGDGDGDTRVAKIVDIFFQECVDRSPTGEKLIVLID